MINRHTRLQRGGVLKVLLIVFFSLVLVCAGLVTLAIMNGRSLLAWTVSKPLNAVIEQCSLPEDQKIRLSASLDGLINDFRDKRISFAQLSAVFQELVEEPFIDLVLIEIVRGEAAKSGHFGDQDLSDISLSLDRLQRGIVEGTLRGDAVATTMDCVSAAQPGGTRQLKQPVTRADIAELMAAAAKHADQAGIPRERYQVDIAGELQGVIDRQLGRSTGTAPAAPPALKPIEVPEPPVAPAPPLSAITPTPATPIPTPVPVPVAPPPAPSVTVPPSPVRPSPAPVRPPARPVPGVVQPKPAQPVQPRPPAAPVVRPKTPVPPLSKRVGPPPVSSKPAGQAVPSATRPASIPQTKPAATRSAAIPKPRLATRPAPVPKPPQTTPVALPPLTKPAVPPATSPAPPPVPAPVAAAPTGVGLPAVRAPAASVTPPATAPVPLPTGTAPAAATQP